MFRIIFAFFILSSIFASVAQSAPSVGDQAVYVGTMEGKPTKMKAEIVNVESDTDHYTVRMDFYYAGQHTVKDVVLNTKYNPVSCQWIQSTLEECVTNGGQLDVIKVKAGTFKTCKIYGEEGAVKGTQWIGAVPFFLVKAKTVSPNRQYYELQSFKTKEPCN